MIWQAIILADGPGPLFQVGGKPFLFWLVRELSRFGVEEAVLLGGGAGGRLRDVVPDIAAKLPRAVRIVVAELAEQAGMLDGRILLCEGTCILDGGIADLLAASAADDDAVPGRMLTCAAPDSQRTASHDRAPAESAPACAGIGVFRARAMRKAAIGSLGRDILPALADAGALRSTHAGGWFVAIDDPAAYARAQSELPGRLTRPALFLDRDGVINVDHGYVGTQDRFEFVPGALDTIRMAHRAGWHVFVVTNQSGVARGFYTEDDVRTLHRWMTARAIAHGGTIDDVRYCPFHPDAELPEYRRAHDWRKPAPGMILDLIRAWNLDPGRCLLIGDQASDMEAAARAGIAARLFRGGDLHRFAAPLLGAR